MSTRLFRILPFLMVLFLIGACGEETTVVESGSYDGTISEVNPDAREIYVDVPETGTLELYFTDETTLTRGGTAVSFDELAVDQAVRVQVERVGQRLDPIAVEIIE